MSLDAEKSLIKGSRINQDNDETIQLLNPTLYTDSGTGKFYYDLYMKSTNGAVTGEWKQWDGTSSYVSITGTHGGVAYSSISAAANGSVYKTRIESNITNDGKFKVDHTGTGAYLDYWWVLNSPGVPRRLQAQGEGVGAHTKQFFLYPDRNYTFTTDSAQADGFTWKYWDGVNWVAFANGTDSSFVATPPANGHVQLVCTASGSEASIWWVQAHPR